jgi:hypothetical protein
MARFFKGQSGNPRGRPLRGTAIAELARAQVRKYKLIEKLGRKCCICAFDRLTA